MLKQSIRVVVSHLLYGMYVFLVIKDTLFQKENFLFLKVGGQEKLRGLWNYYYQGTEGLIFVVDSNDPERINEAREELYGILKSPNMTDVPIVIIANKQDLPSKSHSLFFKHKILKNYFLIDAMTPSEIIHKLGLNDLHGKHRWHVQGACAVTGEGLVESMLEMANLVKKYRK